jgi:hypothetical protein
LHPAPQLAPNTGQSVPFIPDTQESSHRLTF